MNKLMKVVAASVCAVSLSSIAVAAEDVSKVDEKAAEEAAESSEEEDSPFEVGVDFDFFSAYIWRNAIQTDEMVMQPCVWADWTFCDPFYFGFSVWQNYDLTDRRGDSLRKGLVETDYNLHLGTTLWSSEDGDHALKAEFAHEWYVTQFVNRDARTAYPDTRELYLRLTYENPIVEVYGQASWMYDDFGDYESGFYYELGFKKEIDVAELVDIPEELLTLGADWNVGFGSGNYLSYLYGGTRSGYDDDGVREYDGKSSGFGGTTVKAYLTWAVTDWMSLTGTIAYTGVLGAPYREALGDADNEWYANGDHYQRDFIWGGLSLNIEF